VLILKRHHQGPACAGLSCIFLCFFSAWRTLLLTLGTLIEGQLDLTLALVATFVIIYPVPIAITVWCLRVEMERQRREKEEEELK
jgi:hypothetical protein